MITYHRTSALFGDLSKNEKWALIAMTIIGSIIRIAYCYDIPYIGDEIGTLIYIKKDIPYLLSHFATWLTMNYFIVLEKIISSILGETAFSLRLVPMAAGIAIIPLTAILAINFTSHRIAIIAAALTALNPYLIMYSSIIRSYSLLTALSLLLLIAFIRWHDLPSYRRGCMVAAVSYILILSHPNGVYPLACLFLALVAETFEPARRQASLRRLPSLLLPLTLCMILVLISYAKIFPEMIQFGKPWHDTPPTGISYIPYAFTLYFSSGFYGWLSAFFFLTGIFITFKHEKPVFLLVPFIFLPILLMSIQGSSTFPWAYARFLSFTLPFIIIFIAEGLDYITNRFPPAHSLRYTVMGLLIIFASWLPQAHEFLENSRNYPWHHVASFLQECVKPGDVILGSSWLDAFHLTPYFNKMQDTKPRQLNAKALKNDSSTIYFVASAHPLKTVSKIINFKDIQLVVYRSSKNKKAIEILRKDLLSTVSNGEKIDPEFVSTYKNIWDINNALGLESARKNFYYYNLWIRCFELTKRQRNIPFNLQKHEALNFLKNLT